MIKRRIVGPVIGTFGDPKVRKLDETGQVWNVTYQVHTHTHTHTHTREENC
jgi:hypothetical protein